MEEQDPLSSILQTRRIPHGRSSGRTSKSNGKKTASSTSSFNPTRALGEYEIQIGSSKHQNKHNRSNSARSGEVNSKQSMLRIHEFSPGEDGFLASFDFYVDREGIHVRVNGMGVLAGSRKGVAKIVEELSQDHSGGCDGSSSSDDDEVGDDNVVDDHENIGGDNHDHVVNNKINDVDNGEEKDGEQGIEHENEEGDEDEVDKHPKSTLELEDEKLNRRARAFEKNSFRNPKFWMRWRGKVYNHPNQESDQTSLEENTAYIIFSGNDCARFEGTMTSTAMEWDNVKIKGRKVRSQAGACPYHWIDFDS